MTADKNGTLEFTMQLQKTLPLFMIIVTSTGTYAHNSFKPIGVLSVRVHPGNEHHGVREEIKISLDIIGAFLGGVVIICGLIVYFVCVSPYRDASQPASQPILRHELEDESGTDTDTDMTDSDKDLSPHLVHNLLIEGPKTYNDPKTKQQEGRRGMTEAIV